MCWMTLVNENANKELVYSNFVLNWAIHIVFPTTVKRENLAKINFH